VEGVEDSGGWVFFQLPQALPLGRHRVHMVVRGDDSRADTYIEVVEPGTPIILSDIDGTLTTSEWERLVDFLLDNIPEVNPGAPEALQALVDLGYRPMYLTARPEFLGNRTYEFIALRGLPPGIIHTTLTTTGAMGAEAVGYKTAELDALAARGLVPSWVFGNTDSDGQAYDNAGIAPLDHRVFYQFDDPFGGRRIESYFDLLPEFATLDPVCE
jgi:phosphatidate phosphatase PAH1